MRINFDIYILLFFFAFLVAQGCIVAYTATLIGSTLWFALEVCKFMAILFVFATAKIKRED